MERDPSPEATNPAHSVLQDLILECSFWSLPNIALLIQAATFYFGVCHVSTEDSSNNPLAYPHGLEQTV